MAEVEKLERTVGASIPVRVDVQLHDLLMKPGTRPAAPPPLQPSLPESGSQGLTLPEPVFPQHPLPEGVDYSEKEYHRINTRRAFKCWALPFVKSRFRPNELRPIISYLFTEFKCNVDCHYCWSYNNNVKGMTEDVARRSIDWLHSIGCRVLALMRPEVIDRLGDAGVGIVNLAIDCVEEKPGLPKALNRIRPYFDYLVKRQRHYGYTVMMNINITHINQDDVKELTEIARANGIATDYHLNEAPMLEQEHFKHLDDNTTYLTPEDYPKVEALLDYLIEKSRQGYKMANPQQHMHDMKKLMRGKVKPWPCRAGQNNLIIRPDGTLAPCFPMYSAKYDWGTVGNHKFDFAQLAEMKKTCSTTCLSTCNY